MMYVPRATLPGLVLDAKVVTLDAGEVFNVGGSIRPAHGPALQRHHYRR